MAYITKSNALRILKKVNLSQVSLIEGKVYKRDIYFLSSYEAKYLLMMKSILKDPEKFIIEVYQPIINKDTLTYVYESEQNPAFHTSKDCKKLHASFKNFQIPFEIKQRAMSQGGDELVIQQVLQFREWFKMNFNFLQSDPKKFLERLDITWNVQRNINEIERENSGIESIDNYSLEDLEKEIDRIISDAGLFFRTNIDKQDIIRRFQKLEFLAYKSDSIDKNDTGLSDDELKEFLRLYDDKFKKPLKKFLIEYYRVKYNPDLSFDRRLLERLNFKECTLCKAEQSN